MSASLVKQALELSTDPIDLKAQQLGTKATRSTKKKDKFKKLIFKKKEQEKLVKQNLKILQALDSNPIPTSKSSKKNSNDKEASSSTSGKTAFTEEDFAKFEQEYFVTE